MILWDNLSSLFPRDDDVCIIIPSIYASSERTSESSDSYVVNVNRDGAVRCNGTEAMSCIARRHRETRLASRTREPETRSETKRRVSGDEERW